MKTYLSKKEDITESLKSSNTNRDNLAEKIKIFDREWP